LTIICKHEVQNINSNEIKIICTCNRRGRTMPVGRYRQKKFTNILTTTTILPKYNEINHKVSHQVYYLMQYTEVTQWQYYVEWNEKCIYYTKKRLKWLSGFHKCFYILDPSKWRNRLHYNIIRTMIRFCKTRINRNYL